MSVVDSVKLATRRANRLSLFCGMVLGGIVPTATYTLVHQEVAQNPYLWIIVTGGLIYSAKTVFDWASVAFRQPLKALGFVVLVEGVMTFAHTQWLAGLMLATLICINGLATGTNLALDRKESKRRKR